MADAPATPAAPELVDRNQLIQNIQNLERENATLRGQMANANPERVADAKAKSEELKALLSTLETQFLELWVARKNPLDASGFSDRLAVLKTETLAYCEAAKLDPTLWKKLESL